MRNILLFLALALVALVCVAEPAPAGSVGDQVVTTGMKVTPDGLGRMTHGPGTPYTDCEMLNNGSTLSIGGSLYQWDGDKYVNPNGFWYRFDDFMPYPIPKFIGQHGNASGPLSPAVYW